jgi:serine protease AprX
VASLGIQTDANGELTPAEIPFYTHMSGTSMATPHLAGICALILEAKPSLSPADVKALLQRTATNMPGRESWEVGAGYVNAYAAVDQAMRNPGFGTSVNSTRKFNASVNSAMVNTPFTISYNPVLTAGNSFTFQVASGANSIEAKIVSSGLEGTTGNPTNLILTDPNGVQYRSGTPVTFTLTSDRGVAVTSPVAGTWTLKVDGLRGVALPEEISGSITVQSNVGTTNLADIAGPSEAAIKLAVSRRLVDGLPGGYQPNALLTRLQLADYLLMGQGIRQYLPTTGAFNFTDVSSPADILLAEATTAKGAALRDRYQQFNGVLLPTAAGTFSPKGTVSRAALAYSLVQSLGFQAQAVARTGKAVTVTANGQKVAIDDAASIPAGLEGYVSIALELNLINAFYSVVQGPYDLQPTLHATFQPAQAVTRGDFAVIITRTFAQYDALTQPAAAAARISDAPASPALATETSAYPNPFAGSTTISYYLEQESPVSLVLYNTMGAKVRTLVSATEAAGAHQVQLDGRGLAQGTYLFTLKTGAATTTKRLVVQ